MTYSLEVKNINGRGKNLVFLQINNEDGSHDTITFDRRLRLMAGISSASIGIYEKAFPEYMSWQKKFACAAEAGYNYLEISIDESDERVNRLFWYKKERFNLRNAANDSGVLISTMCLSAHRKFPMGSTNKIIRNKGIDLLKRAIEFAVDTGVRIILIPGYDVFYEQSSERTQQLFLEGLNQCLPWASSAEVVLAIENVDKYITSVTHAMWFIHYFNSPWLQLYMDVGNLVATDQDIMPEIEAGTGYLVGVHIKDVLPGKFRMVALGKGKVPFEAVFKKLPEIGYYGPLMIELWNAGEEPMEFIVYARQWLRECLSRSDEQIGYLQRVNKDPT
jgi:L-ribulose-5-phosphate 3-epimerase